jgi:hypothetical protein
MVRGDLNGSFITEEVDLGTQAMYKAVERAIRK